MTTTITMQDIQRHGSQTAQATMQTVSADALAEVREGRIFAQQGDVYLSKLRTVPPGCTPWPFAHGQLAPGSTQGSRHLVDLAQVRLWVLPQPSPLEGPIIEAPDGCVITHPEHGALCFPAGVYQVTFQRAYAAELRRLAD